MKKIFNTIICAALVLLSAACNRAENLEMAAGEGVVSLNVNIASTRAEIDPNGAFELKIYRYANAEKSERELVRKYTSLADVPQYIWLISDSYMVQVKVGEKELASFDKKHYVGTADFVITAGEIAKVDVDCCLFNTPVKVNYDATVAKHFTKEFYTYVCASETFDLNDAKQGTVPTLKYTETKTGFFILPDGCTDLTWYFCGSDGEEQIVSQGAIQGVEADKFYSLSFKYSKDAPGQLVVSATIDYSVDHRVDEVPFSPDPTVKGVGFSIDEPVYYAGGSYEYNVTALDNITTLAISYGEQSFDLLTGTYDGISVVKTNSKNYNVTLSEPFFALLYGGEQTFAFRIKDASGGVGYQECVCYSAGVLAVESYDMWYGTVDVTAYSYTSENLAVGLRTVDGEWSYSALNPSGVQSVYTATINTEMAPSTTYEYALFSNGVQVGLSRTFTTAAGKQIPEAGFDAWSTDPSTKARCPGALFYNLFWDTGNPATASNDLGQLTVEDEKVREGATGYCAYLHSMDAKMFGIGKFAAGNLFVGRFVEAIVDLQNPGGIVEFGQNFEFNARPKAIRFWMQNSQGTINSGSYTSGTDLAKIYCCLTDRKYTVNTTKSETLFTPTFDTEGIFALATWETTENHGEWTLIEIPITYRDDITTKPTTLVLTFTCSGYGDYFTGSTNSWMRVDDVELVY